MESPFIRMAFTITLVPKMSKHRPPAQLWRSINAIEAKLDDVGHKYSMVYEFTKQFNIHYHGIIDLSKITLRGRDVGLYWANLWRGSDTIGFTLIKQMEDERGWIEYITKDLLRTYEINPVVGYSPVIKDQLDLLPIYEETIDGRE